MKKKLQLIAFLAGSVFVIALAIHAGEHHADCRECPLGQVAK